MGLLARTGGFARYAVAGELPENFRDFATQRIAANAFCDIDDTFDERSVGWVSLADMFDHDFRRAPLFYADYLALSMRVDERRVGSRILKKFCLKEEERLKQVQQRAKLSRAQRLEIKDNIRLMLLQKALATPAIYDFCWNLSSGTMLFFSANQKALETFEELFRRTFDLGAILQPPYLVAEHLLPAEYRRRLTELTPAVFV